MEFKDDLAQLGLPLISRTGDAVAELAKPCTKHGITKIISHQETGNLFTFHRDRRVAALAASAGIKWVELAQSGVARPFAARDGWPLYPPLSARTDPCAQWLFARTLEMTTKPFGAKVPQADHRYHHRHQRGAAAPLGAPQNQKLF